MYKYIWTANSSSAFWKFLDFFSYFQSWLVETTGVETQIGRADCVRQRGRRILDKAVFQSGSTEH